MANIEIERKFLVRGDYKSQAYSQQKVVQGYMASNSAGPSIRIRIKGDEGFITVKGATNDAGLSRFEWEKEISVEDAQQLLALCQPGVIDKVRYCIQVGNHVFEVDEFHGQNQGLVVAEVELGAEDEAFEKPVWLGQEVTGDKRYYNSRLIDNPYSMWKDNND